MANDSGLFGTAESLHTQIASGGSAGAAWNELAITLLGPLFILPGLRPSGSGTEGCGGAT